MRSGCNSRMELMGWHDLLGFDGVSVAIDVEVVAAETLEISGTPVGMLESAVVTLQMNMCN